MERRRVKGRFVREGLDGNGGAGQRPSGAEAASPRPRYCRTFTRARVAEALPEIVKKFAEEAKKGSIAHTKVLMKIGGLDTGEVVPKSTGRRGNSVVKALLDNLKELDEGRPSVAREAAQKPTAKAAPSTTEEAVVSDGLG